ncbi:hypothetical protein [Pseudarthrobacter oxydans]|uniref:hypothetical protein n=1 Tax=Pseudarthrobacter oxydans TaxID=1671 RepID=UPI002AA8D458|nr:hypothetical protein [Pseudarthrobacter oxydans]WPU08575.1 hypothetical protein SMD14_15660 [Pseudarthrobacter oxydans]
MRKSAKIITALSVAGLAVAAGSAFTGGGLTNTAGSSTFVGGSVTQTISGATLSGISYAYVDSSNTSVSNVTLTFADDAATYGKTVSALLSGGTGTNLACTGTLSATVHDIICSSDATGYSNATSLAVTVS